jgi:hypothetical protein
LIPLSGGNQSGVFGHLLSIKYLVPKKKLACGKARLIYCHAMKLTTICGVMAASLFACASLAEAGSPKTYQVTGPVLEMNDTMIAVQKGKERWEIARDAGTKLNGDVKVGSKVTITYTMTAAEIEAKEAKGAKAAAKP